MNFCSQNYDNMIKIQQIMLLEVITYLVEHGAEPFHLKCTQEGPSKGKSAYDFALQSQQESFASSSVMP